MGTEAKHTTKKPALKAAERTLKHLRKRGFRAEVCEKYIPRVEGRGQRAKFAGGYRRDLFKFMDILAFRRDVPGALAVQATSKKQLSGHIRNYRRTPEISEAIVDWLAAGNLFVLHGWERVMVPKKNGDGLKPEWQLTAKTIVRVDLCPIVTDLPFIAKAKAEKEAKEAKRRGRRK